MDASKVSIIPKEGETVIIDGTSFQLLKRLGGGGEGDVFSTPKLPNKVVKIYNSQHLDTYRKEKIQLMLSRKINCAGICWPEKAVFNQNNEFVGYVMPEAKGRTPQRSIFIKPLFEKYFPNWKRTDLVQLCITILEKIEYLHGNNIIIGDINPENILIASPTEVYFVDCDSYQIEGFPCPVGTVNFTAPELQGKRYDTLLRSFGNEYFSVATLLFMLMMPGKPPYSQQGGGSPAENIRGMNFSYPFGEASNRQQPEGLWRFMWSHLPYKVKEMFYNTFRKGASNSTENTRFTTKQWLDQFREYKRLLDNGTLRQNDEQSEWIYPTRFKHYLTKCKTCGREVFQTDLQFGNCPECDAKLRSLCKGCGNRFFNNQLKYGYCKECNDVVVKTLICQNPNCGKSFAFTRGEQLRNRAEGWDDPKRCPDCRAAKKNGINVPVKPLTYTPQRPNYIPQRPTYTSPRASQPRCTSSQQSYTRPTQTTPKKKRWCFITTAVCEYLGKPDDCWELTLLI